MTRKTHTKRRASAREALTWLRVGTRGAVVEPHKPRQVEPLVLGHDRFLKFSAVEGITVGPRVQAILSELDAQGFIGEARQQAIRAFVAKSV